MSEDKYAVVVDGAVVDTAPTKKAANEVVKELHVDDAEVRAFDPENDVVTPLPSPDAQGIRHLR